MKTISILLLAGGMFVASCSKTETMEPSGNTADGMRVTQIWPNGDVEGTMQAYMDGHKMIYTYRQYSEANSEDLIQTQPPQHFIFRYQSGLINPQTHTAFAPILTTSTLATPTYFREVMVTFNNGGQPVQVYDANQLIASSTGHHPQVTLTPTNMVYKIGGTPMHTTSAQTMSR